MTVLLDANVLVRHFTGTPPDQARRATAFLVSTEDLRLVDLVVAETSYVLQSVYAMSRDEVATLLRVAIMYPSIVVDDVSVLFRTLDLFQAKRIDFTDAYLVAVAESTGSAVGSFDRTIDRAGTVLRLEP